MSFDYNKDLIELISEHLPDMLWVKDIEGKYLFANRAVCENLLMADMKEVIGKDDIYLAERERSKHPENSEWHTFGELCFDSDLEVIQNRKAMSFEEFGNIKGQMLYLAVNKAPFYDDEGNILGTVGTARDITEFKHIQLELKKDILTLENSQRIAEYGTWEIDAITGDTKWSDSLYKIYGVDRETFKPSLANFNSFLSESDKKIVEEKIAKIIKNRTVEEIPFTIHRADGKVLHMLARGEAVYDEYDRPVKLIGASMNITNKVELIQELTKSKEDFAYQANHDSLTSLPNRTLLFDRLHQSIELAKRHGEKLAVIFIDLDHFKEINDSLGHEVGDRVLVEISKRIEQKVRVSDTLARLGGDEFCVVLNNIDGVDTVSNVIEAGMEVIKKPITIDGNRLYLGMSVGVSIFPDDGENVTDLLRNADSAMYKAKANGRNRYHFYNEIMTLQATERIVLESALREALKNGEFIPYFQPQIDVETKKIMGMELLVRWQSPTYGLVSPAKFIPLAERTGLIVALDRLVMKQAIKQFSEWNRAELDTGKLSMNLAVKHLEADDFLEVLHQVVAEHGCCPKRLELEITESDIMNNPESSIEKLEKISQMGINLAVDDFGTGYSSLSYLKRLPINKLKIDKSFIDELPHDEEDCAIAKTIIGLCKNLGLEVIAEGVETQEQKDFLYNNGCNLIQGYYYAKPMPAEEMTLFLKTFPNSFI